VAAPDDVAISIVGLTKRFGKQTIWEDVTFDIPKGQISVILGPSGTGKSVLLKHFVGLLKPTAGHVYVGDQDIPALKEKELFEVRKKFGVLFQDGALFGSMTIEDNVAFPLREHTDLSEATIRTLVQEKLEIVGLAGAEKKYPAEISGGMKKRAGLARALVLEPEILLFDEPDSGLDPVRTAYLNLLAVDLKKRLGPTIIIVTHHIETARTIPDYIGLIFARKLVKFDTRENMLASDLSVVTQFLSGSVDGPIGMSEEKDAGDSAAKSVEEMAAGNGSAAAKRVKAEAEERKAKGRAAKRRAGAQRRRRPGASTRKRS
jgi:phospholipid/cholesterol/gamma-HCH transport system ATP-binding protein